MVEESPKTAPAAPPSPPLDMSWKAMTIQWGTRAKVHKQGGLTMEALNVGAYGEIPDFWEDRTRMPRGAFSPLGETSAPVGGYYLQHKSDFWSDNSAELYEEGISRRWSPAADIPWEFSRGLPDDVELAICQVSTELSQMASIDLEVVAAWLQQMSYGYHEVKLFLSTELFDAARHFEAFRKRAMVNGGGLGLESLGLVNRVVLESIAGWTETTLLLHIMRGTYVRTIYRYLAAYGPTITERELGLRALQDTSRHIAYAMQHVKYAITAVKGSDINMNARLLFAEPGVVGDLADPVMRESLACALGGGVRKMDEGMKIVDRLHRDYVRDYLRCLDWIGIKHRPALHPTLAAALLVED